MTPQQAAVFLQTHDQYLILTHVRPDGDTIGCAAGLCRALRQIGKTAYVLPNRETTSLFTPYLEGLLACEGWEPCTVVSVDIAARGLFPENALPYLERVELAIDHHPSQEFFAKETCLDAGRAACGELVYEIIKQFCQITPEIGTALYVAVSTDCGCFAYGNTTADTHRAAAALMDTGIDYHTVNKVFFRTKTRKRLALEADMLANMEFYDAGRVVLLFVPISLMERSSATESDAEDLSSLGGQIEGTDCAVTLRELRPDVWKLSVRTGPRVNATNVCRELGGGGHAAAAGCTVEAPLEDVKRLILQAIARHVPDYQE